jgi:hypothetical protein
MLIRAQDRTVARSRRTANRGRQNPTFMNQLMQYAANNAPSPQQVFDLSRQVYATARAPQPSRAVAVRGFQASGNAPRRVVTSRQSAPVSTSRTMQGSRANFSSTAGSIVVSHREYLQDVAGSVGYNVTKRTIQPAMGSSFTWLHRLASSFQRYRVRSMRYTFIPSVSTNTAGRVMLGFNHDTVDNAPSSKSDFASLVSTSSGNTWSELSLVPKPAWKELYTRVGNVTDTDLKTYDCGAFYLATYGQATTATIGEVFVDYTIELLNPQAGICPSARIHRTMGGSAAPLGTVAQTTSGSLAVTADATNLFIAEPGHYIVDYAACSTTAAASGGTSIIGAPESGNTLVQHNAWMCSNTGLGCQTVFMSSFELTVSAAGTGMTFSHAGGGSIPSDLTVYITISARG